MPASTSGDSGQKPARIRIYGQGILATLFPSFDSPRNLIYLASSVVLLMVISFWILPDSGRRFFSTSEQEGLPANVVAQVNGENLKRSDYERIYTAQKYYFEAIYPDVAREDKPQNVLDNLPNIVLDNLIQEAIISQHLKQAGIEVKEDEVRARLQKDVVDKNFGGDWKLYDNDLRTKYKSSVENSIANLRLAILIEKLAQKEDLKAESFDNFYSDLKGKSLIKINLAEYKQT